MEELVGRGEAPPMVPQGGARLLHQVETTVDFARGNRWLCCYRTQDSVRATLGSHVRWLERMGQPAAVAAA